MKILIIEDEQLALEKLTRQLRALVHNLEIIGTSRSIRESLFILKEIKPNLIFSDIHLSDGLSFQIFEQTNVDIPIIFTTAYDEYAIRAFKANSIDYLLKPVSKKALQGALDKFHRIHEKQRSVTTDFAQLISAFTGEEKSFRTRFLVHSSGSQMRSIRVEDIAYFFAEGKYTYLMTNEGAKHFSDYNITRLKEELDPQYFFKINRKYIIHIDSIRNMIIYSSSRLKLVLYPPTLTDIVVSTDRSPQFKKWLGK